MRILMTGSRDWDNTRVIEQALVRALNGHHEGNDVLVHGAAKGADTLAANAARQIGIEVEAHPAMWSAPCDDECPPGHRRSRDGGHPTYCPRVGFRRNKEMVDLGADVCLAFIKNESKGATMTAKLAEDAGIPVWRYTE